MADVTRRDRAQILLITSLLIATVFVGLALVVNSGIYTENLATRSTGEEASQVAENQQLVERDLQGLIDRSNAAVTDDDYTAVENGYDDDLALWSTSLERRYGKTGRFVEYREKSTVEGTRIQQTDVDRGFTAGGSLAGQEEWTLVNETEEVGRFELLLQRPSLLDATTHTLDNVLGEAFNVVIETGDGDEWHVYFFRGVLPDTGYVLVEDPSGFGLTLSLSDLDDLDDTNSCASTDGDISVDLLNASFGGEHCPELEFYTDEVTGTAHNVSYQNTETDGSLLGLALTDPEPRVNGTYDVIVDTRADRAPYYDPTSGDDPTAKAVIYEASVTAEFRSEGVAYENDELAAEWSQVE